MEKKPDYQCSRCRHTIGLFITHVRMDIEMMVPIQNPRVETKRYCDDCCRDTTMAVLFADLLDQPVRRIQLSKVWS